MQSRRQLISQFAWGVAASAIPLGAQAETFENARIIAGFAPGGTIDAEARRIASRLSGSYAKTVFVDNRAGAGGQIAISALKASAPDGSTLLVTPMSMLGIYPHTYKKLPYDPIADLTPVSMCVNSDIGFAVGPAVPASVTTIAEFLAWCKNHPDNANFGSPAPGSMPHFVGVLVGRAGGVDLRHVGYRGAQPAIMDLLGGQVAAVSSSVGEFLPHLPGGKLRILATSGASRSRFAAQVPTLAEQGFKSLMYGEWHGVFLPGKASASVVKNANLAVHQALTAKEVIDGLATMGLETRPSTPEELAAALKSDLERWGRIVKSIGFSADA